MEVNGSKDIGENKVMANGRNNTRRRRKGMTEKRTRKADGKENKLCGSKLY